MASLFGSQNVVFDTFSMEASETHFSTGFVQSHLNRFHLSWARNSAQLGSEHGPVGLRIVVWLDSGLVSLLGSRTRLDLTRGSARFAQDPDQLEARLGSLFGAQFTSARESGSTWGSLGLGESAQCSAQLSSGLSSGLSWGLAGGWGTRDSVSYFINLVRTFLIEGLTRTEPAGSRACSAGPDTYFPIGMFRVIGRI